MKLGVTVHTYNPSTWETEAGGSVQGQSQLSENPSQKQAGCVCWVLLVDMVTNQKSQLQILEGSLYLALALSGRPPPLH